MAVSHKLQLEPGWRFGSGLDDPTRLAQLRRDLWDYYRDHRIDDPVVLRWYDRLRVRIYLGNDLSLCLFAGGSFEPNEFVLLSAILEPDMTFIDGGANDGLYSLFAARRVGAGGRVLAVEPSAREFERLGANLRLNGFDNVTAIRAALGVENGVTQLAVAGPGHEGLNTVGVHISNPNVAALHSETVALTTIDSLIAASAVGRVDVIKLDVEGSELAALKGARATLVEHRPILQLEVEEERLASQAASKAEVVDFMTELGYELFVFDELTAELRPAVPVDEFEGTLIAAPAGWSRPALNGARSVPQRASGRGA